MLINDNSYSKYTHIKKIYSSDLDYNKSLNIIASGDAKSIKLWNGNDGSLIL